MFFTQKRADAVETIKAMIGPTEAMPGCQGCTLCSEVDNDDELILLEKWHSQESMEEHIRSDEFRKILAVMELAIKQPKIAFISVSSTAGMEFVERLRCEPETEQWAGPFGIGR
jgi:quinol monooxygenase YgiN